MFQVVLIVPPFAGLKLPSLALTQFKFLLDSRFNDSVSTEVLYLNHDFAGTIGIDLYQYIAVDTEAPYNGLGDWFFRQAAFPELEDNTDMYFQRFFPHRTDENERLKRSILQKRHEIERAFDELIDRHELHQRDLVGFTSMFSQNTACFTLARKIKERNPNVLIVMGGANCETPMGQEIVKNVEQVDYIFSNSRMGLMPESGNFLSRDCRKGP